MSRTLCLPVARAAAVLLLSACGSSQPVHPLFDPQAGDLPSPNDVTLGSGPVALEVGAGSSAAEAQLQSFTTGWNGFSVDETPQVRFSAPIEDFSLSPQNAFWAFDLGAEGAGPAMRLLVTPESRPCNNSVLLHPTQPLQKGHIYLFAVRGGELGVRDANGNPVGASKVFALLRQKTDLRNDLGQFSGNHDQAAAQAGALESIRERYEPYLEQLEASGLPRNEVAVLWTFRVHDEPEAWFSTQAQKLPFPNDLWRDPSGHVSLPILDTDDARTQALKQAFNQLDGFSTTGTLTVDTTAPVDPSTVGPSTVRLFDALGEEKTDLDITLSPDQQQIRVAPITPLLSASRYTLVVGAVRDAQGRPLRAMPLGNLLKLDASLVDGPGHSTLRGMCDANAQQLEPLRSAIAPGVSAAFQEGIAAQDVSAVFTFTTQDFEKGMEELWLAPYRANLPATLQNVVDKTPLERSLFYLLGQFSHVSRLVTAEMQSPEFMDHTTRAFRADGGSTPATVQVIIAIPDSAQKGVPLPVVVFGHALGGSPKIPILNWNIPADRYISMEIVNRLAEAGFASIAFDWPLHGERTLCATDSDCDDGAQCMPDGACMKDGAPADLARDITMWPGLGKATPKGTGNWFLDLGNLIATRDHFRQGFVDASSVTRLIRLADWGTLLNGYLLDPQQVDYVGVSLGSVLGASVGGIDPTYSSMLLNVPGGNLAEFLRASPTFSPMLDAWLVANGISRARDEEVYFRYLNEAHWALDEIDPVNLVRFAALQPRTHVDPVTGRTFTAAPKRLHVQIAADDNVVPRAATEALARAAGLIGTDHVRVFEPASHVFLLDPLESTYSAGQDDAAAFLSGAP